MTDDHIDPLRIACAADPDIWKVYPINFGLDGFDASIAVFRGASDWTNFAVIEPGEGRVVGMTHYIRPTPHGVVEIGGTYIEPSMRGGALNGAMKKLMIENAFASGFVKIEFRVDTRNQRSMAAVRKLGAQQEGVMRQNMVTWTGYRRDTAVFGLLREEWAG